MARRRLLETRASDVGGTKAKKEKAVAKLNDATSRTYYANGNLKSKSSSVNAAIIFKDAHRSDLSSVMLGSGSTYAQAQNLLLREVRVLRDASVGADGGPSGKLVRAYRLQTATDGWRETSYAYEGRGRKSELRWGFPGFDATRSTDGASAVVTYRRYRMDFPHYGEVAAGYEYDAEYTASAEPMYQRVTTFAEKSVSHVGALAGQTAQTTLPRVEKVLEFHYEDGDLLGAAKTDHALDLTDAPTLHTDPPMAPEDATVTATVYHTATAPAATWGAVPGDGTLSAPQRETVSTATFQNRTSGAQWLIGFANSVEESHNHPTLSLDVETTTTTAPHGNTMRPGKIVRFEGDTEHELTTNYTYDASGNMIVATDSEVTVGTSTTDRTEKAENFIDSRYPGTLTNAEDQSETLTHDARFGLVKTLTDPNNRTTTLTHDAFGPETLRETPDGVEIETSYESCADSGVDCAAVAGTGSDASVTPVMRIKETSSRRRATMDEPVDRLSIRGGIWTSSGGRSGSSRSRSTARRASAATRATTRGGGCGCASQPYYSGRDGALHTPTPTTRGAGC